MAYDQTILCVLHRLKLLDLFFFYSAFPFHSFARKHGPDTLRETYLLVPPRDKIDGVIFVTSATSEVPKNLMNMVKEAAWPNKTSGNYKRRSKD